MLDKWHSLSRKTQWFLAAVFIVGGLMVIGGLSENSSTSSSSATDDAVEEAVQAIEEAVDEVEEETPSFLSSGQENALSSAESYLNTSAFSRKGLIEQLKYEGYSLSEATYAVDNVVVDWNEQAALSAQSYLNTSSFSRSGLVEQLMYEGFSRSQAEYGVSVAY